MKFLIKFPTRNRPKKFIEVFLKYQYMLSNNHDVEFLVSMDEDDTTMNNPYIKGFLDNHKNVKYYYGNSSTKIEAINADLDKLPNYDIMLLASDDMIPRQPSYDEVIASDYKKYFPNLDGVVHYNDGRLGPQLNTFCIMGKPYFERFGYIYHPSYKSVFCDNEFTDVSKILNKHVYVDRVLFEHGWINYVGFDVLAQRNENPKFYEIDSINYINRRNDNFGIKI